MLVRFIGYITDNTSGLITSALWNSASSAMSTIQEIMSQ
jgi:hypothetical protein